MSKFPGVVDVPVTPEIRKSQVFNAWRSMVRRCHSQTQLDHRPTYETCSVCPEWMNWSSFRDWVGDRDITGLQLDKDLKVPGNKVYGPHACVFIPAQINNLFQAPHVAASGLPQGVRLKAKTGRYFASISKFGKDCHLGYFATIPEAESAYRKAKYDLIQEMKKVYTDEDTQTVLAVQEQFFA